MPPREQHILRVSDYRTIANDIAARLAEGRSGQDPLAPWREEVIVPSGGVAEAIAEALLERMPNGVAGLELHTIETFARRIVNAAGELPRTANEDERRLAMRTAVRSIAHPMMESRGIAAMLERSYRDVRDSGVTLAELRMRIERTRGLRNRERLQLVLRAFGEYERLIAQLTAIDPADLLLRASALVARMDVRPQLLAGFYDMTGAQLSVVRALGEKLAGVWMPSALPFAQPLMTALSVGAAGLAPPDSDDERRGKPRRSNVSVAATRFDELHHVAAEIRTLLDAAVAPRDIAIVARSLEPYDARLIQRFASEHGFTTTLSEAVPLPAHRLGRGAITLLRLRDRGFVRAEVLELVRDGLRVKTRIDVEAADRATRRARIAGGTSAELQVLKSRSREVDDYIALVAELEELTARIDADFLERLPGLFRIETEQDLDAAEALDEIASLFGRTKVWNRGFDVNAVIDTIEHRALDAKRGNGVWAGDILRFRGRSVAHLFVVRMQDDVFPQRRNEDPLLPDSDRRLLGLREIGDGSDEERLLLQLLHDNAAEVRFSYAASDGFGKVLRGSRFVRGGGALLPIHEPQQARANAKTRQLQLLAKSGTRSVFDGYLDPAPLRERIEAALARISPTQLEDFGECPQKYLLKHVLGVEDFDDPERELQIHHREKGTLDHRILERFYRGGDTRFEVLEEIIDEEFDQFAIEVPPFNKTVREMERRATKRILRDFVTNDLADLAAQGLEPKHFEYKFGNRRRGPVESNAEADAPPFVVNAGDTAIRIDGMIDRIDAGGGRLRIVDYKSGKALRHANLSEKIDRGVRLQLALYALAVSENFANDDVSGTIKPLVTGDNKPSKFSFELKEKKDGVAETLRLFVTAILGGTFPAFPNERDDEFNSCKYCPVTGACRTKHDADERYAVAQSEDPRTLLASLKGER